MKKTSTPQSKKLTFTKIVASDDWKSLDDMLQALSINRKDTLYIWVPVEDAEFVDKDGNDIKREGKEVVKVKKEPGINTRRPRTVTRKAQYIHLNEDDDNKEGIINPSMSTSRRSTTIKVEGMESKYEVKIQTNRPSVNYKVEASGTINLLSSDDDEAPHPARASAPPPARVQTPKLRLRPVEDTIMVDHPVDPVDLLPIDLSSSPQRSLSPDLPTLDELARARGSSSPFNTARSSLRPPSERRSSLRPSARSRYRHGSRSRSGQRGSSTDPLAHRE
jgi:hypothetical protein